MPRRHKNKVRVATWNIGDGPDERKYNDLCALVDDGVKILGLEEHGDRTRVTEKFIRHNSNWSKYAGDGRPGGRKTCILYEKSVGHVIFRQSKTLVGKRRLKKGAGPENASPKVANKVRFRVRKRRLDFIVGHEYATVHNRRQAARLFMQGLADYVRRRVGTTIVVGDMNMTPGDAMMHGLNRLLKSQSRVGGTHGSRQIDRILVRGGKVVKAWKKKNSSDHDAVIADVEF